MASVMLDRSVWDKMYKCLELGRCVQPFTKDDFNKLDLWLKKESIRVILFSIEEIESYLNRGTSPKMEKERRWLESKKKEYDCELCKSTLYTNDPNLLSNIRTVVSNKGDIAISPDERESITENYHISTRKHRDVNILLIAIKNDVDIFIHENPADFDRNTQIQHFIADMGIGHKILNLSGAISRIKVAAI
ncbi:MAG: hypothetical protein JRI72_10395 [Deltaproteobacteria bacterium]|nr:hypothetical protein [Deltaproteobacteria bacterium]